MAREWGIVDVLGEWQRGDHFCIGGPESAGAACLYAAWMETRFLEGLPAPVRWELLHRCLLFRWTDDGVQINDTRISRAAKRALRQLGREDFYGGGLVQTTQFNEKCAFGFDFDTKEGLVLAKSTLTFEHDGSEGVMNKQWPVLHGGMQFSPERIKVGAVVGRLCRLLDMCNMEESVVKRQIMRMCFELRLQNYSLRIISTAIHRANVRAWMDLKFVLPMLQWDAKDMLWWNQHYDQAQRIRRPL